MNAPVLLFQQPRHRALDVAKSFSKTLGIEACSDEGGVGVVILEVGCGFLRTHFVEGIGSDVVDIDKFASCLTGDTAAPSAKGLVATLNV